MISAALAVLEFDGQRSELSEIYEKYRKRFVGVALKVLRNREDAEDAVQEAFLRIADRPDTFFFSERQEQAPIFVRRRKKCGGRYAQQG